MRLASTIAPPIASASRSARVIQLLRVTPPSFAGQAVVDWRIDVDRDARLKSQPRRLRQRERRCSMSMARSMRSRSRVRGEVLTEDRAGMIVGRARAAAAAALPARDAADAGRCGDHRFRARFRRRRDADPLGRLHALMDALHERIAFDAASAIRTRGAAAAFAEGRGVCQDHAHIFCAVARLLGYPARYVSGHLYRGEEGERAAAPAHAWAEAYGSTITAGSASIPTNDVCPTDAYVRVAVGLDYHDAAPVSGARIGGGGEAMRVEVTVAQAHRRIATGLARP